MSIPHPVGFRCTEYLKDFPDRMPSALLAQWLERAAVNRKVTGSIPVGSVFFFFPYIVPFWVSGFRWQKAPRPGIEPGSSA